MKFELVDPAEGPGKRRSAALEDDSAEGVGDLEHGGEHDGGETTDAAEREEAEKTPEGRLKASAQRMTAQVKQDAAGLSGILADFAQQVADRESPVAGTGHRPGPAPSSFRADRFSPEQPGPMGGPAAAPPPAPPATGHAGGGRASATGSTMEPDAHRGRPNTDDRR